MSDYWDHEEYGELEAELEKQTKSTRKWMALHDEAVERETLLLSEGSKKDAALQAYHDYRGLVLVGSAEAIGQAEDDLDTALGELDLVSEEQQHIKIFSCTHEWHIHDQSNAPTGPVQICGICGEERF